MSSARAPSFVHRGVLINLESCLLVASHIPFKHGKQQTWTVAVTQYAAYVMMQKVSNRVEQVSPARWAFSSSRAVLLPRAFNRL